MIGPSHALVDCFIANLQAASRSQSSSCILIRFQKCLESLCSYYVSEACQCGTGLWKALLLLKQQCHRCMWCRVVIKAGDLVRLMTAEEAQAASEGLSTPGRSPPGRRSSGAQAGKGPAGGRYAGLQSLVACVQASSGNTSCPKTLTELLAYLHVTQ